MRTLGAALIVLLMACDGGAPEPCGPIAQQSIHAGDFVRITLCFTHPSGESLFYGASSSDPRVAAATVTGSIVTVTAVAPGSATITVEASTLEGSTASQEISVLVPNRSPELIQEMGELGAQIGRVVHVPLTRYFSDPDGEPLSYRVTGGDNRLLNATTDTDILLLFGIERGETRITVTATDQAGESVVGSATVLIRRDQLLFSDNFDFLTAHWETHGDGGFEISDGLLTIWPEHAGMLGSVQTQVSGKAWTVETLTRYTNSGVHSNIVVATAHPRYPFFTVDFGEHMEAGNVRLRVYDDAVKRFAHFVYGLSPDLTVGSFFNASLSTLDGVITVAVNGVAVISEADASYYADTMIRAGIGAGPITRETGLEAQYDWIRVFGIPAAFDNPAPGTMQGVYR